MAEVSLEVVIKVNLLEALVLMLVPITLNLFFLGNLLEVLVLILVLLLQEEEGCSEGSSRLDRRLHQG